MNLSVVIPVYNEVESLPLLHQALQNAFNCLPELCWEVVYVDDGSSDGSPQALEGLAAADPQHVCVVELRRNFGQTAAIAAGIDHAQGEIIVLLDADLQNDPADIPMMLEKIDQGYDVVSGWRVNRQDTFITRTLPSRAANWLISTVTGVHLHDYGCTLKAYRREVLTGFRLYGEMHRFIPAYAHSVGARMVEVPVTPPPAQVRPHQVQPDAHVKGRPRPVYGQVPDELRQQTHLPVRRHGDDLDHHQRAGDAVPAGAQIHLPRRHPPLARCSRSAPCS